MDNSWSSGYCTGGSGGLCHNDIKAYFKNKVGSVCETNWLFNNYRWKKGKDAFDNAGTDYFNWDGVNCVSGKGFYVSNKVNTTLCTVLS